MTCHCDAVFKGPFKGRSRVCSRVEPADFCGSSRVSTVACKSLRSMCTCAHVYVLPKSLIPLKPLNLVQVTQDISATYRTCGLQGSFKGRAIWFKGYGEKAHGSEQQAFFASGHNSFERNNEACGCRHCTDARECGDIAGIVRCAGRCGHHGGNLDGDAARPRHAASAGGTDTALAWWVMGPSGGPAHVTVWLSANSRGSRAQFLYELHELNRSEVHDHGFA